MNTITLNKPQIHIPHFRWAKKITESRCPKIRRWHVDANLLVTEIEVQHG